MYLQRAREREKEMDRLLQMTINKAKNEYEYEILIKMGEANEFCDGLRKDAEENPGSKFTDDPICARTYRAYKSAVICNLLVVYSKATLRFMFMNMINLQGI